MIDKLISSDFDVLARQDRRVPSLESVLPKPVAVAPGAPIAWRSWLLRATVVGLLLVMCSSHWFAENPQSLPIIALAVISLLGLIEAPVRKPSFHRELGAILGACGILIASLVMFWIKWHDDPILEYTRDSFTMYRDYTPGDAPTIALVSALAVAGGYGLARCIRPRPRSLRPWSALATVVTATTFLTALGARYFSSQFFDYLVFRPPAGGTYAQIQLRHTLVKVAYSTSPAALELSDDQTYAFIAAGAVIALVISVAIVSRARSKAGDRWLALVSHITVVPAAIAVAMWQLLTVLSADYAHSDAGLVEVTVATASVLVAFTSMTVRRARLP